MSTETANQETKFEFGGTMSVEFIKAKIQEEKEKHQGKDIMWKPEPGSNVIRIFPYKHAKSPFTETYFHYLNDKKGGIICPKSYGEDCAICQFVSSLYSTKIEEDKLKANSLRSKARIFVSIIVRTDIEKGEEPKVKFWELSSTVYASILKFGAMEDYGDLADPYTGFDLIVDHSAPTKENIYGKTEITPRRKESQLLSDMNIAKKLYEDCPNINSLPKMKRLTSEEIIERLENLKNMHSESETSVESVATVTNSEKSSLQADIDKMLNS